VFDGTFVCFTGDGGPAISGAPILVRDRPGGVNLTGRRTGGHNWFLVSAGTHYPTFLSAVVVDEVHCRRSTNPCLWRARTGPGSRWRLRI
jgi:hypothetical protein